MSWKGKDNPGHKRRMALWREIEREFQEPLVDTIIGLREQGNSWRTVAGALGVSKSTLQEWRKVLGLPMNQHKNVRDESSMPEHAPNDLKAQLLGYKDIRDAVIDLRFHKRLSLKDSAECLGVSVDSIVKNTPRRLRGAVYIRSGGWWQQRREQARKMTQRTQEKIRKRNHLWNALNDEVFSGQK